MAHFAANNTYPSLSEATDDVKQIFTPEVLQGMSAAAQKAYHFFRLQKLIEANLGCSPFEAQQYIKTAIHRIEKRVEAMGVILDRLAFSREGFAMLTRLHARDHLQALAVL